MSDDSYLNSDISSSSSDINNDKQKNNISTEDMMLACYHISRYIRISTS